MTCRVLTRVVQTSAALTALFGFTMLAAAQEAPEDTTPPPASPPASDEQPPAEKLPPCPSGEQAVAPTPPPPPFAEEAPPPRKHHHNVVFAPQEVALTTGAGPANYFGSALNATLDVGAGWDARVTFGARSVLALEAAYVGAENNIDTVSGIHGRLDSQGVDGDLRLQLPTVVTPYLFGGVGYNHMALVRTSSESFAGPLNESDNQVTIPAGAGFSAYLGKHTTVDLRGTYRLIPDNGLTVMNNSNIHQWVAQAHVGYVF
ncbi:MAG TPA: outer membrane beta-barrel protein [Polyangia bacterium]|jgi:opacity protein-like surface antigen